MSGNYQSRVFTFISKRTNRLKDTCAQGFRHIKVAVVWSGQALLYPFHLLAQTTKIFQPQIAPPAQKPVLPPVSDINIEQALELVVDAGYPIFIAEHGTLTRADVRGGSLQPQVATGKVALFANEDSSNLGYYDPDTDDWEIASYSPRRSQQQIVTKKPVIQGLSSLLADRQLVLVTTENEILDILTRSQQQEIRRKIGIDLAIDWYQWSTGEILDRHAPEQLSLNYEATTKQLAIASGEDRFARGDAIALGVSLPEAQANAPLPRTTPNLLDRFQNWLKNLTAKPEASITQSSDIATAQIESELPRQIAPASYLFTPQPPQIDSLPETLRERLFDLPQLPPINEIELPPDRHHPILATFTKLQPEWLKQWWSYYRDYLSISPTGFDEFESSQIIHQTAFQLTRLEQPSEISIERIAKNNRTDGISNNLNSSKQTLGKLDRKIFQDVEHNPDWIEAESERVGYSKSLITKLLEWVDKLILQLENWLIKIWNILRNYSA